MAKKQNYDLSNVGGRPKDWLDREREYRSEFSEWDDFKFTFGPLALLALFLLSIAGVIYGFTQIIR